MDKKILAVTLKIIDRARATAWTAVEIAIPRSPVVGHLAVMENVA